MILLYKITTTSTKMSQEINQKMIMISHYQKECDWQGEFPRDKVRDPRPAHAYICLERCKTMIEMIKKQIAGSENKVRTSVLKNGKYRQMNNGHEELYDIEDAVNMMTRDDKKYLKKFEDHIGFHENIKKKCVELKNEIDAECKKKSIRCPPIHC